MKMKTLFLLLILILFLLAGCNSAPAPAGNATLLPTTEATVTPGGLVVMALPTLAPPTPTLDVTATPISLTPAYLLTALPAGGGYEVCPPPGEPSIPPIPATYNLYATTINQFLSSGGTAPFLTAMLSQWGAITETAGMVTEAHDLTGDGVFEIVVVMIDPFNAEVSPQPGQMLIFGCHEEAYRLLYASDYGPGFGIPQLLYVGDMNANSGPEVVFFQQRCQSGACVQSAQVLSWSQPNDGFITLNVDTVGAADGRFSIADLDGDGVNEIMIQGGGLSTDISAGPPRSSTTVWDWNGLNYVRAITRLDAPLYRIHMVHDADSALEQGDTAEAIRLYREALDNPRLGTWNIPNEQVMLRGYTLFKLVLAYAEAGQDGAAADTLNTLTAEYPPQYPGNVYLQMANGFWQRYQATLDLHQGCLVVAEVATARPEGVFFLNSYGPANRTYQIPDICPF